MVLVSRRDVFMAVLAAFLFTPLAVYSADVDDLKATSEQALAALNKRDVDAYMAFVHDQYVGFGANAPFPAEGKAALRQVIQALLSNSESFTATPINSQFRVIGNLGVVSGYGAGAAKLKDGPMQTTFIRVLQTWTKSNGKWLLVASHLSRIPSGN